MSETCDDTVIAELLEAAARDERSALSALENLTRDYPRDARLHFLHGSLLAAAGAYRSARDAIGKAVEVAPDFAIARFQLGFLAFTSGEAEEASATWRPLLAAEVDDPLRLFVEGLEKLARDDFEGSAASLRDGIARNRDNPALNGDMARLIEAMPLDTPPAPAPPEASDTDEPLSLTQLALQQSARKRLN